MRLLVLAGIMGVVLAGCKKPQSATIAEIKPQPTTGPTDRPGAVAVASTTRPTTGPAGKPPAPAAVAPKQSELTIAGSAGSETVFFPPARIVLVDGPVRELVLSSKDPSRALRGDYEGNRYYFRFRSQGNQLIGASASGVARISHESNLRRDEPDGIFLGDRQQLQAREAIFQFQSVGNEMFVTVEGTFLVFERRQMGAQGEVRVAGVLRAVVEKP